VLQALNETGLDGLGLVTRGTHWLNIQRPAAAAGPAEWQRARMQSSLLRPTVLTAPLAAGVTPAAYAATYTTYSSGLSAPLLPNVGLVTVHSYGPGQLLVRLAHLYEVGEDLAMSQNVTVNLAGLFSGLTITAATEMTLIANQPLTAVPPTTYRIEGQAEPVTLPIIPPVPAGAGLAVTLSAMEIRTFLCDVTYTSTAAAATGVQAPAPAPGAAVQA
jgi:alpha-mannosidase